MNDVDSFSELIQFCWDNELRSCEWVKDYDELSDYINECLIDWAREYDWTDLRDMLDNISTAYEYYDVEYNIEGIDYDFERYKAMVLEEADDDDIWDEVEPEEECEPEPEESSEEDIDPESLLSILSLSSVA